MFLLLPTNRIAQPTAPTNHSRRGFRRNISWHSDRESEPVIIGFIVQNRHNRKWHFSAVLSYCPRRRATRALVHGLTGPEARHLAGELSTAARCQRGWLALPMLLPLLLVRTRLQTAMFGVRDCHRAVFGVECRTGLRTRWDSSCEPPSLLPMRQGNNTTNNNTSNNPPPPAMVDFNAVTADITSVASKLAYAEYLCEIWGPKIAAFDDINRRVLGTALEEGGQGGRGDGDGNDDEDHGLVRSLDAFRDETVLLQSTVESVQLRARYMSKRAQAQVQTVSCPAPPPPIRIFTFVLFFLLEEIPFGKANTEHP